MCIYIYIPGSSKCVKFVPFHPKNLPKGRNFTYLEDPGMITEESNLIQMLLVILMDFPKIIVHGLGW